MGLEELDTKKIIIAIIIAVALAGAAYFVLIQQPAGPPVTGDDEPSIDLNKPTNDGIKPLEKTAEEKVKEIINSYNIKLEEFSFTPDKFNPLGFLNPNTYSELEGKLLEQKTAENTEAIEYLVAELKFAEENYAQIYSYLKLFSSGKDEDYKMMCKENYVVIMNKLGDYLEKGKKQMQARNEFVEKNPALASKYKISETKSIKETETEFKQFIKAFGTVCKYVEGR